MKKLLFTFFVVMCCVGGFANGVLIGDLYYILNDGNKTAEVTYAGDSYDFNDYAGSINIPSSVHYDSYDYTVTSIGDNAFNSCFGLTSITIPESVKSIGYYAFQNCSGLTSITIPESVTSIGSGAFYGCSGLTSITIPESVTSIGASAFRDCSSLTSITIPESVESIGDRAFYGCSGLTSITIPKSVTSIGDDAFNGCIGLTSITIPKSVKSIGKGAFSGCSGLTLITIPESVESIGDNAFKGCKGLTSITIPEGVKSIEQRTFEKCTGLTSITIPKSVTSIGDGAFQDCSGLTSITIPKSVTSIGKGAFSGCSGLTLITIPESVESIGDNAFKGCKGLTYLVVLAATPPTLGDDAFRVVKTDIPVYVPDVDTYTNKAWGGFKNFKGLGDYKINALNEIDAAMTEVKLSNAEVVIVSTYKNQIENANDLATADAAKAAAMAIIKLSKAKYDAIATIKEAMQGEAGSAYLNGLVEEYVNAINTATDESTITSNQEAAISKIELFLSAYKAGISEKLGALGTLGTEQPGPAVEVIDQNDKGIILYNPKKVNFIKVGE